MAPPSELPEGSLASRVLDSSSEARRARRGAREALASTPEPASDSPAGRILALRGTGTRVGLFAGLVVAAILHGGLYGFAFSQFGAEATLPDEESERPPMQVERVEIDEPEPEPEPEPKPEQTTEENSNSKPKTEENSNSKPKTEENSKKNESDGPPSPAEAGEVASADSDEVADFTDFDIATGDADSYAGGTTASDGESKEAVDSDEVDPDGEPDAEGGAKKGGRARPVSLSRSDWECDWPRRADDLSVDRQTVVLRAVVRADGTPTSVDILSDPGFGFGEAAKECALEHTFDPARDDDGRAQSATSPKIRVEFER